MSDLYKEYMKGVFVPPVEATDDISGLSIEELFLRKQERVGLSKTKIAKMLDMDVATLDKIIRGNYTGASVLNTLKVAIFIGVSMNDFLNANADTLQSKDVSEICHVRDTAVLCEYFSIDTLNKIGFFTDNNYVQRINDFFGFKQIKEYADIVSVLTKAYSMTRRSYDQKMRDFWTISAYAQFKNIDNPNMYDRDRLMDIMPKIRPCSQDVETGLYHVARALYSVGVTMIYQPSLPKMQVRGATMEYNGKPCIVISDLNKRYPTLWFSLFHELYHVLFDFDDIVLNKVHLSSDEGDLFLTDENAADKFAHDFILSPTKLQFIKPYVHAPLMIKKYAQKWGVHSSLIYALIAYDTNNWAEYSALIPRSEKATERVNTNPFEVETIREVAETYKQKLNI